MVFLDRSGSRGTEHLEWRVRLLGAGAILAVLGMYFGASWLIWAAIAALAGGFLVRLLPGGGEEAREDAQEGAQGEPKSSGPGGEGS